MKGSIKKITATIVLLTNLNYVFASTINFSNIPLFLVNNNTPNVMVVYGNSNSMDEQADGQAVGSANSNSKSMISRAAVTALVNNNIGKFNMGLTGYGQTGIYAQDLANSPYDVSYNPLYYNPLWTGARNSATNKKFRIANPSDPTRFIYYNVALPGYMGVSSNKANDTLYCVTTDKRSNAFSNGEVIVKNQINGTGSGPWLSFDCYLNKASYLPPFDAGPTSGAVNNAPTSNEGNAGYSNYYFSGAFYPTDSDLAQGITNYGNQLAQFYAAQAWFSNTPVGYGYVHTPISFLNSSQASKILTKLGTPQFSTIRTETNSSYPLVNAGLSPIASTIDTVTSYFTSGLSNNKQGGPLAAPPNSCGKNFNILLTDGLPSILSNGNISYTTSTLLSDLVTEVGKAKTSSSNIYTYVVGFALPYGVSPTQLDQIAVAGGTGASYYATDSASLNTALASVMDNIVATISASSSVALNSGYVSTGDYLYQARFQSADWSGDLLAIPVSASGAIASNQVNAAIWRSGPAVTAQAPASRNIITMKSSTQVGIPFEWPVNPLLPGANELDTTQSAALSANPTTSLNDGNGQRRLNFLRGDGSNEGTLFRTRAYKLGDIINSAPVIESPPSGTSLNAAYIAFKQTYANRPKVVYVGANDGMLHAISTANGSELFGYVPNAVFNNLNQLTYVNYSHRFYVDGSPIVSDVYSTVNSKWKTVLVSGMGEGAKGIFALDVTNPSTFTESNASTIAKFEYTSANNSDLGYIQGQPSIVKLNNGKWAAIFGNGLNNSGNGQADLFIVDVDTGALIKEITTGSGSPINVNGLGSVTGIDTDGNGTVDYVYGGDLNGNMWKFDLTSSNPTNWGVALSGQPLFTAPQPITVQPEVTVNPLNGGFMVFFGTGLYLQTSDNSSTPINAFYGIWDNGTTVSGISQLVQQTVTTTVTGTTNYRNITSNQVNYPTQRGWYLTFPTSGERDVTNPVLQSGNIIFSTIIPSTAACSYGGTSWLYSLNYLNGSQNNTPTYDTNGDGKIGSGDATYGGLGLSSVASAPTVLQGLGSYSTPLQEVFLNQSNGNVLGVITAGGLYSNRRVSWKQIINH